MASAFVPDHEIIVVTKDMAELPQQCYDVRVAVFISEQGEFIHRSWALVISYKVAVTTRLPHRY